MISSPRIAITGIAVNTPLGNEHESVCERWRQGAHGFVQKESGHVFGECASVDLKLLPDRKLQKAVTRKDVIGITTAIAASRHANIDTKQINPERFGMFVGSPSTQIGDLAPFRELVDYANGDSRKFGEKLHELVNPMVLLQNLMNNTLCYTSIALDIRGVNGNYLDFQAAGLNALREGVWALREGRADAVLVGAVAATPDHYYDRHGIHMGYLSSELFGSKNSSDIVRPFDARRSGTVMSEGAVFLVLEREADAHQRGAVIHGFVDGVYVQSEGRLGFIDQKESLAYRRCIENALSQIHYDSGDVKTFMIANANGSLHGDAVEAGAVYAACTTHGADVKVHAYKGSFGETGETSSLLALVLGLDILAKRQIPKSTNFTFGDDISERVNIVREPSATECSSGIAIVRSFSGICGSIVFSGKGEDVKK